MEPLGAVARDLPGVAPHRTLDATSACGRSQREGVRNPFVDLEQPPKPRQERDWLTPEEFGKGGKSRRQPLPARLAQELLKLREARQPAPTDPVFCGLAGGRLQETILADIIGRAAKRAGIEKHVTAHTLRHTAATWLRQEVGDTRLVAEYLGPADLSTVARYAHVERDELFAAAGRLEQLAAPREERGAPADVESTGDARPDRSGSGDVRRRSHQVGATESPTPSPEAPPLSVGRCDRCALSPAAARRRESMTTRRSPQPKRVRH